jgi:hypothetical protein
MSWKLTANLGEACMLKVKYALMEMGLVLVDVNESLGVEM